MEVDYYVSSIKGSNKKRTEVFILVPKGVDPSTVMPKKTYDSHSPLTKKGQKTVKELVVGEIKGLNEKTILDSLANQQFYCGQRYTKFITEFPAVISILVLVFLAGCGGNATLYAPPGTQVVAKEFYTSNASTARIKQSVLGLGWLKQTGPGLVFSGRPDDPSQYIDCGQILRQEVGRPKPYLPYANTEGAIFMSGNAAVKLKTSLDVVLKILANNAVKVDYTFNREYIEHRTMFGVESRPPASNAPIKFDTLNPGQSADGVICRSKLTLEQAVIRP